MGRKPTKDEIDRYARGEDLPPDVLARVRGELAVNAELRDVVGPLTADVEDEELDDDIEETDTDLAERLELLARSRIAVVTWRGGIPATDGASADGTIQFGSGRGPYELRAMRTGEHLSFGGPGADKVRPLALIECPMMETGNPRRSRFWQKAWNVVVPGLSRPELPEVAEPARGCVRTPALRGELAPVLGAAGWEAEPAGGRVDLSMPSFGDDGELTVPEVPQRDGDTHRELVIAEFKSVDSSRVFRFAVPVGRVEENQYLAGTLRGVRQKLPEAGGRFTVSLRKPVGEDWLLLEPREVTRALAATPQRMWTLERSADGTLRTGSPCAASGTDTTQWLLRYAD